MSQGKESSDTIKMTKLKPIERLAEDVKEGDLVRFKSAKIGGNEYTAYYCGKEGSLLYFHINSAPSRLRCGDFFKVKEGILLTKYKVLEPTGYEILRRAKR